MDASQLSVDLTRTILGADALYRSQAAQSGDHLDSEGLVPVHWSPLEPLQIESWPEALAGLTGIITRASRLPNSYQRDWLAEQALAVHNLLSWRSGANMSYEEIVAGTLRIDPTPPSAAAIEAARAARDRAVAAAGYDSFAAYRATNLIPANEIEVHVKRLIGELRRRTEERLPWIRLPADTIGTKVVTGVAFSAYCDYPGRVVWLNADIPLTLAELKQIVAHEAYPGHDAHMGHRDAIVRSGEALADTALVITNTASSVLFEGIAERGLDLLGWRTEPDDAIAWLHGRLQWLASIEVAHGINTGRLTTAEAAEFLRTMTDGEDGWIEAKLRFVTHELRAPFVYGYLWGGHVVGRWLKRVPALRLEEAVRHLYDKMHSPTTLEAHWMEGGIEDAHI